MRVQCGGTAFCFPRLIIYIVHYVFLPIWIDKFDLPRELNFVSSNPTAPCELGTFDWPTDKFVPSNQTASCELEKFDSPRDNFVSLNQICPS